MAKTNTKKTDGLSVEPANKRTYLKQSDVPAMSLIEALRIPQAIVDHYASKPTSPLYVAKALNVDPKGSQFRLLTGAAIAFGLIEGGAQASSISITDLSKKILKPKVEGEDGNARRQAVLAPRIFKDFLTTYDGNALPRKDIAVNVLEDMGVSVEKTEEVLERIIESARSVGFIVDIKDKPYVMLEGSQGVLQPSFEKPEELIEDAETSELPSHNQSFYPPTVSDPRHSSSLATAIMDDERRRKVFITHGKNQELVEPIKKLLEFGELTPIVSVQRQSVSKPVPEKVMDDMRACGAAIIHVDADTTIVDNTGKEHVLLNPNVLIEIGAAMAFYGRRFILLVKEGVKLPSNLQGLYEVRYPGETLDATATIKLLEAIKDIKNYALPTDTSLGDS
jgi:predicted nucleotide-binding protein